METFSASLALCGGNSPVAGEFPPQRPVEQSFDVFFHLCLNKRLSEAGDLRRHSAHFDVIVMDICLSDVLSLFPYIQSILKKGLRL